MEKLKSSILNLINHFTDESLIENLDISELENKTFYEIVLWLKDVIKEQYPKTKLKPMMKSIHYANSFKDEKLKQTSYILDEIEQYLTINKFLNHDSCVEFFNRKITTNDFIITHENLVATSIESLILAKKEDF